MEAFVTELSSKGYHPTGIALDGKIHRFSRDGSTDNGWYIGWLNHSVKDGSQYIVAEFGDWKTGERHTHKPSNLRLSTADKQAIKVQMEECKKKSEIEKMDRQNEAAIKAEKYWKTAATVGSTPYMEKKRISELFGARIHDGILQIPVRDIDGKLRGIQYIKDTYKRFLTGTKVDGCFHTIGEIESDAFLCEGFATGCSIYQATGKTVVIAFNAGNLISVAKELNKKYPDLRIIVCGDDDRFTITNGEEANIGREKAERAAMMCHGATVFPVFESDEPSEAGGKGPTDYNDLHCREGIEKVRRQILNDEREVKAGFIPLGYDEGTFFFYHIPSKDIVKATSFTKSQMFQIAPADYWSEKYPQKNGDSDMSSAINDIIQMSKKIGPFNSTRVRGTGVWIDEERVVVNLGRNLVVDGREMGLSSLKSWYIYIQTKNRLPPMSKPLSVEECKHLLDACTSLKWRDSKSGYLLAGWLFNARIAGALSVRPHIWLTGGSGTGKSTVMDRLVEPALGCQEGKIYLQGSSTEAGIRQRMKCSSIPPIFDEFETTGDGSKERIANLVELLRNTWSSTKGSVVKGSSGGLSIEYNLQFAALVSSIRVNLDNDADRSRFSILELAPHGNDLKHWAMVKEALKKINEQYGERLFARASSMVPIVKKSQKRFADALAGQVNQRYGQQVGMLLAGYWALTNDDAISAELAESLVRELDLVEEKNELEMTDEMECLYHLLSWKITVRNHLPMGGNEQREMSIGEVLLSHDFEQTKAYGIKREGDRIVIADYHSELTKIFKSTHWVSWHLSLRRLEDAIKGKPTRFFGRTIRSTSLPLSSIAHVGICN